MSDISFELSKEDCITQSPPPSLAPISEVEDVKCECCGMCEECTPEYIEKIRGRFSGKWICGLCGEAVKEEMERSGADGDEALSRHMSACVRFNKFGRAFPVLVQAQAMREMLKKSGDRVRVRGKSFSPRDKGGIGGGKVVKGGGIARSSSCIPAITRDMNDLTLAN